MIRILFSVFFVLSFFTGLKAYTRVSDKDSIPLSALKIEAAKREQIHLSTEFRIAEAQIRKETFIASTSDSYLKALGAWADRDEDSCKVLVLFRSLPQRMPIEQLEKELAFVDSIYINNSGVGNWFENLVESYSELKKPVFISDFQETEDFQAVLKNLRVGDVSRPFVTAKGIYVIKKLEEIHFSSRPGSTQVKLKDLFDIYHIQFNSKDRSLFAQTPFRNYTLEEFNDFKKDSMRGQEFEYMQFQKFILGQTIVSYLEQDKNYQQKLEGKLNEVLIDLAFKRWLVSNKKDFDQELQKYIEYTEKQYKLDRTLFTGILIYSPKKSRLSKVKTMLDKLPRSKWSSFIEQINFESKKRNKLSWYKGSTYLNNESLVKRFYEELNSSSKKKIKKANNNYLFYGRFEEPIIDGTFIDSVIKPDFKKFLEKEWVKDLMMAK